MNSEMQVSLGTPLPERNGAALPRGNVLNYVTRITTQTRVRAVSAGWLRVIGVLMALSIIPGLKLDSLGVTGEILYFIHNGSFPWPHSALAYWLDTPQYGLVAYLIQTADPHGLILAGLLLACFICGIVMFLCATSVKAGNVMACHIARGALMPPVVSMAILTVVMGLNGVANCTGGHAALRVDLFQVLWLLFVPVGIFLILAMMDLLRFLRWIARNPTVERPKMPFLPS